jgi:hypothetical protein
MKYGFEKVAFGLFSIVPVSFKLIAETEILDPWSYIPANIPLLFVHHSILCF